MLDQDTYKLGGEGRGGTNKMTMGIIDNDTLPCGSCRYRRHIPDSISMRPSEPSDFFWLLEGQKEAEAEVESNVYSF